MDMSGEWRAACGWCFYSMAVQSRFMAIKILSRQLHWRAGGSPI
jgi:hypothetical protein